MASMIDYVDTLPAGVMTEVGEKGASCRVANVNG